MHDVGEASGLARSPPLLVRSTSRVVSLRAFPGEASGRSPLVCLLVEVASRVNVRRKKFLLVRDKALEGSSCKKFFRRC